MLKTLSSSTYPNSIYADNALPHPQHPTLTGDNACDVCVIGGGYTGLSAALHLAENGYDVILLESSRIGWGASGRNGGQLGSAQVILQPGLLKYGEQTARDLWNISEDAKALVKGLIQKHNIKCDYKDGNMACAVMRGDLDNFQNHMEIVQSYGYEKYKIYQKTEIAEISGAKAYVGGLYDPTAGHLNPLNLAIGYANACVKAGVRIFETSPATDIQETDPAIVKTAQGQVKARFVILGCNGYLGKLNRTMAKKILPADNYQLVTEPLSDEITRTILTNRACFWDTHHQVYYYRLSPDNRLIFGGGVGLPGHEPQDIKAAVRAHMLRIFPHLSAVKIDYGWAGTFCTTLSRLPDFGRLAKNIFYAQGYTGHGVGMAAYGGKLMADLVAGTAEQFDALASIPQRRMPGGIYLRTPGLLLGFMHLRIMDTLRALRK